MAQGNIAKKNVEKKIIEAFGKDYITTIDKKIYLWSEENGERIQIALTMTCPKVPVGDIPKPKVISTDGFGLDFDTMPIESNNSATTEYTQEEKDTINKLIAELGL